MEDYERDKGECREFLEKFEGDNGNYPYLRLLKDIQYRKSATLRVRLDDVEKFHFSKVENTLLGKIEANARRYENLISQAADELLSNFELFPRPPVNAIPFDVFDQLQAQRQRRIEGMSESLGQPLNASEDPLNTFPPDLTRRYMVIFEPRSSHKLIKLREVGSGYVGKLVTVQGIVTHMTDVKPLIKVATYVEEESGDEFYQLVQGRSFMPLARAPAAAGGSQKPLRLETFGSKFVKYQELKIQELATEVPQGTTPRSIVVQLKGDLTRSCKPGEAVIISGVLLPEPYKGFRAMRAGLLTSTFLEAMIIKQLKQTYQDHMHDSELQSRIEAISRGRDTYDLLSSSVAPEIFGHEDVKKALLLLMVGGNTKRTAEGMLMRGDVHICLMGDPGVAKSQLIKHVAHVCPRAVYTTGKGSSGVGLTAAVQKDPVTGEMVLEGGALVLADKGICAIDEFDKMDEGDRTAIHEVMEQQTVSIAKAGITTTLNTRTTLLAAANPAWGRYNPRKSPAENINLPAALLSRFDLMWLILDRVEAEQDRRLAAHVMTVHKDGAAPTTAHGQQLLSPELLRAYMARAKTFQPSFPEQLTGYVASVYAEMKSIEANSQVPHSYTTARTLLSIMRLSQALAKLRFESTISQNDVDEALRLMKMSKMSLYEDQAVTAAVDPIRAIYISIRDDSILTGRKTYTFGELTTLLGRYQPEQIRATAEEYAAYNVFNIDYPRENEPTIHIV